MSQVEHPRHEKLAPETRLGAVELTVTDLDRSVPASTRRQSGCKHAPA